MLNRYIRDGRLFADNPLEGLLSQSRTQWPGRPPGVLMAGTPPQNNPPSPQGAYPASIAGHPAL